MTDSSSQTYAQSHPPLEPAVATRLRALASRLQRLVLIEGLAWVVGFIFVAALIQFGADYAAGGLRWSMRATLLLLVVVAAGWLCWRRMIAPLRMPLGPAEAARLVERRYPQLCSTLISAVRFSGGEVGEPQCNSPTLIASVVQRAGRQASSLDFNVVLDPRRARRSAVSLLAVFALSAAAAVGSPEMTALWFSRNVLLQDVSWPRRTRLFVELDNGELIGARGDDLPIQAHAKGVLPRVVEIVFKTASGKRGRETMVTVGRAGAYRYTLKNAQEDFEFYLAGGDDRTDLFHARLLERPRVEESRMRIDPPAYTRQEASTLAVGQRAARLLPGSTATLWIRTNKPVTRATLMAGRETIARAAAMRGGYEATFSPAETATYQFALVDEVGLENRRPVTFSLRLMKDEPPRVRMRLPGVGDMITPEAVLPIELEFADAYGLATAELVYQISRDDAEEQSIPLSAFKPHMMTFTTSLSWSATTGKLVAGERIVLSARATDFDTVSGPNHARSAEMTLRVVTRDELLAELARREQEYRMDFERLVDGQEQLRGQLLTLIGQFQEAPDAGELAATLAPLERRQRNLASSVNVVRQQFEQVLAELRVNRLDTRDVLERLGDGVIEPLTRLAKRDMVTAADTLRRWARDGSPEQASLVDPQQVALLSQMRAVLASMIQWEGYHEVVNMLRDIVRLQDELGSETKDAVVEDAAEVFED